MLLSPLEWLDIWSKDNILYEGLKWKILNVSKFAYRNPDNNLEQKSIVVYFESTGRQFSICEPYKRTDYHIRICRLNELFIHMLSGGIIC